MADLENVSIAVDARNSLYPGQQALLAVDTNVFLDLAAGYNLASLAASGRTIIVTTEVYRELENFANDPTHRVNQDANVALQWILEQQGRTNALGVPVLMEFNASVQGYGDLYEVYPRSSAGELSIERFAAIVGTVVGGQFLDVMVVSNDKNSPIRPGASVIGASFDGLSIIDYAASLVTTGAISPAVFLEIANDLRVGPQLSNDVWTGGAYDTARSQANLVLSSDSIKIAIFENDQGVIYTGRIGFGNSNDEQIGFVEIGRNGLSRIVAGDQQVILTNDKLVGILAFDGPDVSLRLGRVKLELDLDDVVITERSSGLYDQCFAVGSPILFADGATKPIENIQVGDVVLSYNYSGALVPGRVTRTFRNEVSHLLNVHGLKVTPGHATLCGAGMFKGRHVPIIDILLSDGALVQADGTLIRMAINAPVGSLADAFLRVAVAATPEDMRSDSLTEAEMRVGTLLFDREGVPVSVLDCLTAEGYAFDPGTGLIAKPGEAPHPLFWFGRLPRPEDYILTRSQETLEGILTDGEWECSRSALIAGRLRQMTAGRTNRDG